MDSPSSVPSSWLHIAFYALTTGLGSLVTLLIGSFVKRKRETVESAKIVAETQQIEVSTELLPMNLAKETLAELQRLQAKVETKHEEWVLREERLIVERNHWERKCGALEQQVDLLNIEIQSMELQMRKLDGYVRAKGLNPNELDKPKR